MESNAVEHGCSEVTGRGVERTTVAWSSMTAGVRPCGETTSTRRASTIETVRVVDRMRFHHRVSPLETGLMADGHARMRACMRACARVRASYARTSRARVRARHTRARRARARVCTHAHARGFTTQNGFLVMRQEGVFTPSPLITRDPS